MQRNEIKTLLQKFPKQIKSFRRQKIRNLSTTTINYMIYDKVNGNGFGCCVGDGKIYAMKQIKCEGIGKVLAPDLTRILAQ